jgi:hypothetical protein
VRLIRSSSLNQMRRPGEQGVFRDALKGLKKPFFQRTSLTAFTFD